ncbi:MAG: RDD family protein [Candidatus Heimdallarchaeota archaeon]
MARWKLISGIIIALIALPFFFGGAAMTIILSVSEDNEGYYMSPWSQISEPTGIGYVFNVDIESNEGFDLSDFAQFKLRIKSDDEIFVGIAKANEVDAYLANDSYHVLTNLDIGWDSDEEAAYNKVFHRGGTGTPGPLPRWDVSNRGTYFTLHWVPEAGNWTVVVLNGDYQDAQTDPNYDWGYNIQYKVGAKAPILRAIGIGLLTFGLILFIIAGLLIFFDIKQHRVKPTPIWATKEFAREPPPPTAPPGKTFCANCGTQAEEADVFCTICGDRLELSETRFRSEAPYEEPHPDSDQLIIANFGTRFWAWVIDVIFVVVLVEGIRWMLFLATGSQSYFLSGWDPSESLMSFGPLGILLFIYWFVCEWQWGETLGKKALGLQVVDQNTGELLKEEPLKVILSAIGKIPPLLFLDMIIGWILGNSWEKETGVDLKQRLFSRIAGTTVVKKRMKAPSEQPKVKFAPDR